MKPLHRLPPMPRRSVVAAAAAIAWLALAGNADSHWQPSKVAAVAR